MTTVDVQSDEGKILEKLLIKEEDALKKLETIVSSLSHFIGIDVETKGVIFKRIDLTNAELISLYLAGAYFAKRKGVFDSEVVTIEKLSRDLNIPTTTLSAPIKKLVDGRIIERIEHGKYRIVYYQLERLAMEIEKKYKG